MQSSSRKNIANLLVFAPCGAASAHKIRPRLLERTLIAVGGRAEDRMEGREQAAKA